MDHFQLSDNDKAQGLWLRLRAHIEARLAEARERNDWMMSDYETAGIRGEIRCLKRIIALGDDRPDMTGDDQPPD